MKLIGRIEPVMHLQGRLNAVPGGVYAPEEPDVTYVVRDKEGVVVPSELVEAESTTVKKIIRLLIAISDTNSDDELEEIEREVDALLNETDPNELGNLSGHSIVNKIRLAQTYRDEIIAAIEAKGITAKDKQPLRTVSDLIDQITRETKTVTPSAEEQIVKPSEGVYGLESVIVKAASLEELNVWATNEVQEIYPPEGYIGFSKVVVDAVPDDGGSGGDSGDDGFDDEDEWWIKAEDTTFGDDYYNVPTGNYDYSAGADAEPSYIPEIPGEGYKALFSQQKKVGKQFRYYIDGVGYDIKTKGDADVYIYATHGHQLSDDGSYQKWTTVLLYTETEFDCLTKKSTDTEWTDDGQLTSVRYGNGWYYSAHTSLTSGKPPNSTYTPDPNKTVSGIPVVDLGQFADGDAYDAAARSFATAPESEEAGGEQFLAFVSSSQILYDGAVINNMDMSPMTIYECNHGDNNTWTQVGTTDGTDYPVGAYTFVWCSHDLKDLAGQFVTQSKSDDPIAEMSEGDIGIPVERNETYTIEGETVNTIVSAAQKVTGGKTPLTPTNAALALDEYYNHPAEEGKW